MLRVLAEIETLYGIPPGTMRSAISRGVVTAEKKGKITMIDENDPSFLAYLRSYHPRGGKSLVPGVQVTLTPEEARKM